VVLGADAARARLPRAAALAAALARTVVRVGTEGREPGAAERRQLLAGGAGAALLLGTLLAGPLIGILAAAAGPLAVARLLRARRERYREAVERSAPELAQALADALAGGHSVRGALMVAAPGLAGAAGHELRHVGAELALGEPTERVLEAMRERTRAPAIDTIVAALLLQRRAGGDLARLLRDSARALEDQARLDGEMRAATAQARFTGIVVVLLPVAGALLAELASPGYLRGLAGSFLTAWLTGIALVLQFSGAVAIRRIARVKQ
jgi:tight adherence protein B